jgi:hypothetical protein
MRTLPRQLLLAAAVAAALASARPASADDAPSRLPPIVPKSPIVAYAEYEAHPPPAASPALVIAGGVLGGAGVVGALVGLILMGPTGETATTGGGSVTSTSLRDAGRITVTIGAPLAAVGLVMTIIGLQPAAAGDATGGAKLRPEVAVGPTGAALRWRF